MTTPQEALETLKTLFPGRNVSVTNSVFSFMEDSWFLHVEENVTYAETFEKALKYQLAQTQEEEILFRKFDGI